MTAASGSAGRELLLRLYDKSILKKAKYKAISEYLPGTDGKVCLDIGADNGVLSYLLRQRGGTWYSADLELGVVESIRGMVEDNVYLIDGGVTEFSDDQFDLVVIIDFLEHIHADERLVAELGRIMKDDACLIVNVPHDKPRSPIRWLRLAVGLTDEKHGHVRPGYTLPSLTRLLSPEFVVTAHHTYSRFFVELYDVVVSLVFDRLSQGGAGSKGVVVGADDLKRHQKKFRVFSLIYPLVWCLAQIDRLLFFTSGYSLIVRAERDRGTAGSGV
jgi:SAM-dependent methyltransferase